MRAAWDIGTQSSVFSLNSRPRNRLGATPTTWKLLPFRRKLLPRSLGSEPKPLPQAVAQHGDGGGPRTIVCRRDEAPESRLDTQGGAIVPGNHLPPYAFGSAAHLEAHGLRAIGDELREDPVRVAVVPVVRIGDGAVILGIRTRTTRPPCTRSRLPWTVGSTSFSCRRAPADLAWVPRVRPQQRDEHPRHRG
jgi:hypothetical protein